MKHSLEHETRPRGHSSRGAAVDASSRRVVGRFAGSLLVIGLAGVLPVVRSSASAAQAAQIDRAVLASLPAWHGRQAAVVEHLDLARAFATRTQWTLVVARFPGSPPAALTQTEDAGPIAVCFVKEATPHCSYAFGRRDSPLSWFNVPYHFISSRVVFAGADRTEPLLLLRTEGAHGGNGSQLIETQLFAYDRQADEFKVVFSHGTGSNNNQETRFVEHGPLRGDVITAEPTRTPPYVYWISVYARGKDGQYSRPALRYRSQTRYGDGNPLPVIDSEMPDILRRLGHWKRGDPPPIPAHAPSYCRHTLYVVAGEEWCKRE
jgi:hypothetical protein